MPSLRSRLYAFGFRVFLPFSVTSLSISGCTEGVDATSPRATVPQMSMSQGEPDVRPVPEGAKLPVLAGGQGRGARPLNLRYNEAVPASPASTQSLAIGTPSLIWFANDGSATFWKMNGPSFSGSGATVLQIPAPWRLAGAGDLNADGNPDFLWEATTDGTRAVTFMNGAAFGGGVAMMFVIPPEWRIVGVADFDANTKPDLVLSNSLTKDNGVLFLNGTAWTGVFTPLPKFTSLRLAAIGDMNSDTKPDMIWQDTASGQPYITLMNGTTAGSTGMVASNVPSSSWHIVAAADMDANGKGDFILENVADGSRSIWHMASNTRNGLTMLPTVPTAHTIVAASPVFWPVTTSYIVDTGQPVSSSNSYALWSLGRPSCTPIPTCQTQYESLGAQFTLSQSATLDLVEGWIFNLGEAGGAMYVNVRADSANFPGPIVHSKGYFIGQYFERIWVPFSQYGAALGAGTYWLTFEPIPYGGVDGGMPNNVPSPLLRYGVFNHLAGSWAAGVFNIGFRISALLPP